MRKSDERVLEDLLEKHILDGLQMFDRNLSMYEDERFYGRQLIIPGIGRIDLLTIDNDTNDLVVIEVKQGKSDDLVVGQILRYMGWLKEKLVKDDQKIYGIICVNETTKKLKSAVSVVPTIEIYEYGISLTKID
jgi:restriction system protein